MAKISELKSRLVKLMLLTLLKKKKKRNKDWEDYTLVPYEPLTGITSGLTSSGRNICFIAAHRHLTLLSKECRIKIKLLYKELANHKKKKN